MFRNYILIAWRNLRKHKLFSLINILGLAIGMCVCLLILQYVFFEFSFDKFHRNYRSIYRVTHARYQDGQLAQKLATTYSAVGPAMKHDFPEVQLETSFSAMDCILSTTGKNNEPIAYRESRVFFVDPDFLKIFTFPMTNGEISVLEEPNTIILTERTANKYFGKDNPVGKVIKIKNHNQGLDITAAVKGVCENPPANSQIQFDFLVSKKKNAGSWVYTDDYTYLLLSPTANPHTLESKLPQLLASHTNRGHDASAGNVVLSLQPLSEIHLHSDFSGETGGNAKLVWFLVLIAILILFIAYVNYINLSTVKAIERAKEVGLRKVFGTLRKNLIQQFFFESLLVNFIAISLAIVMALLCHQLFNQLTGTNVPYTFWTSIWLWISLLVSLGLSAFISGFYPATFLSGFKPVDVLSGVFPVSGKGVSVRKGLVVFQFSISIVLMIVTFTIYRQVNYMRETDLGMDMTQTLIIAAPDSDVEAEGDQMSFYSKLSTFQTELLSQSGISGITSSSSIPGEEINWTRPYRHRVEDLGNAGNLYSTFSIGPEFIEQFHIKTLEGENFIRHSNLSVDSSKPSPYVPVMINEAAVKSLGFASNKEAVGQVLVDKNGGGRVFEFKITGILQDFHQKSLKEAFTPIIFRIEDGSAIGYFAVKLKGAAINKTVAVVESKFKELFHASPFEYFFLDDFFNQQYKQDQKFSEIFGLFAGFAIFVGCLGLLGLSLFTSMQKIKEIGIRKVLGASSLSILVLIQKDFVKLIVISGLIAWPISWFAIHMWLQNYVFRIPITAWLFLLPIVLVLLVAIITVTIQAWKASIMNPVKSIRQR